MKFLSNTYDPNLPDAKQNLYMEYGETVEQAWKNKIDWLSGKVIGEPQATPKCTVEQLKSWNMVGVYDPAR